jgi:hypothetical protein
LLAASLAGERRYTLIPTTASLGSAEHDATVLTKAQGIMQGRVVEWQRML